MELPDDLVSYAKGELTKETAASEGKPLPAPAHSQPADGAIAEIADMAKEIKGKYAPPQTPAPVAQAQKIEPPARWSAEWKQQFAQLPPDAQKVVADIAKSQERAFTQRMQQVSQHAKRFEALEQELAPRRQTLALRGLDDVGAVRALFAAQDILERTPAEGIKWLMQSYGVTPEQLGFTQKQQQQGWVDPALKPLQDEISQLKQMNAELAQRWQAFDAQAQQQVQASAAQTIEQFAAATGPDGQPLHPFFDEVVNDMTAFIQSGYAADLKDAYDKAVRANPATFAKWQAQQQAQQQAAARARAEKARTAGASVSGMRNGAGARMPANNSLRAELEAQFASYGGRV